MIDASLYMRNTQRHIYYIYYAYIICLCSQSDDDWCKLIYLPFHPGRSQSLEQLNPENRKNSMQCRFFDKILNKLKYFSHLTVPFKSLTMASRLKRESYSSKHKTPRFSLSSCGIIINSQYLADEGSGNWFNPHCLQHHQQHQHQHHDHHQHQDQDLAVEGAEKRFKGILIVSSFPCFFTCVEDSWWVQSHPKSANGHEKVKSWHDHDSWQSENNLSRQQVPKSGKRVRTALDKVMTIIMI